MPFTSKHRFIHILSHIHLSHNHLFSTHPLRKLIFGHYISSFPLSYHTPSGITQITFLNAPSKSPYKQMHGSRARSDAYEQTRRVSYCEIPLRKSYIMMLGSKAFDPSDTGLLRTACSRISALLRSVQNGHPPDVLHPICGRVPRS